MNRVTIMGRLCADPDFRQTQSGIPVCRFRVAVNRPKQKDKEQQADFINCTAWRSTAEFICRYFTKGQQILLEGQLRNNDYTDNNGVKHYSMDVLVDQVYFTGSKNENAQQETQQYQPQASAPVQKPQAYAQEQPVNDLNLDDFEEILGDGEVPF